MKTHWHQLDSRWIIHEYEESSLRFPTCVEWRLLWCNKLCAIDGAYIGKCRKGQYFRLNLSKITISKVICMPTLPEHLSSPPVFSGVCVTRSLVLCVCFVDRCLFFCPFSFGHCVVSPSIYRFWLPLWHLQTLLVS